ncbi:hypothetical protein IW261DRAFT_1518804 [Armillaria novae-zelandiae]|uniref:Secreted protein n=1 Tax=Armillaria novae-zelandiae TaxID=153914 RepID=A0AA39TVH7_9AGAR|nr:hypothetical protein IW261DRAFT_1518804 [Armillaria novae-zelandiae]
MCRIVLYLVFLSLCRWISNIWSFNGPHRSYSIFGHSRLAPSFRYGSSPLVRRSRHSCRLIALGRSCLSYNLSIAELRRTSLLAVRPHETKTGRLSLSIGVP